MADIIIDSDSGKFKAGADQDLEVYNDGSHSYIKNTVNDQTIILSTKTGGTNTSGITLDGSNDVTLLGNIIMADDTSIGIADDAERIEFDGAGDISILGANVGIGTDTPQGLVVSKESSNTVEAINFVAEGYGDVNDTCGYYFASHNVDAPRRKAAILLKKLNDYGAGDLHFVVDSNADDASLSQANDTKMTITQAGLVGIGTTSPQVSLDVNDGKIRCGRAGTSFDGYTGQRAEFNGDADATTFAIHQSHATTTSNVLHISADWAADFTGANFIECTADKDGTPAAKFVIQSDGNVGIGTSSPSAQLHLDGSGVDGGDATLFIERASAGYGVKIWVDESDSDTIIETVGSGTGNAELRIGTQESEAIRINSSGFVGINNTDPTEAPLSVLSSQGSWAQFTRNSHATVPHGVPIYYTNDPDNHSGKAYYLYSGTTERFMVENDGDVKNHDNSYGSISDERIKTDIRDANSQWDDIKALRVRNFKRKDDVVKYGEDAKDMIGLVAQEAELVSPHLVKESTPAPFEIEHCGIPESGTTKTMMYSVLYMKAIKALQEAMTRIEALENA